MTFTKPRSWTVDDYHRMITAGILTENDHVELLNGQIIEVSPQQPRHAATTQRTARYLDRLLEGIAYVRMQLPITLGPNSEPEPDIAVVSSDPGEYGDHHPTLDEIILIIEVSDSTLLRDRKEKALAYAKAGIKDYWVIDVCNRLVYVLRNPSSDSYQTETVFTANDSIAPLKLLNCTVSFTQFFLP
jgi:Uma2 family endonuclease